MRVCSLETRSERRKRVSKRGIRLNILSRSSARVSRFPSACSAARRSRIRRARALLWSSTTPAANATHETATKTRIGTAAWITLDLDLHARVEQLCPQSVTSGGQPVSESRGCSGRSERASDLSVLVNAEPVERKNVLHPDAVALHSGNLGDGDDFARSVSQPRNLHYHVDCGSDLLPDRALRNVEVGHGKHALQASHGIAGRVRVDRRERTLVPRVHRLQHVEGIFASHLAHDNSVRTHTETVDHQLPLPDRALSFDVRRPGFEAHHVFLLKL